MLGVLNIFTMFRLVPGSARYLPTCDLYALFSTSPPFARMGSVSAAIEDASLVVTLKMQSESQTANLLEKGNRVAFTSTSCNVLSCRAYTIEDCECIRESLGSMIACN